MANTVSALYAMQITATETFDTSVAGHEAIGANNSVVHNGYNINSTIAAGTSIPATTVVAFEQALTAGAAEIDLTALPGTNGDTVDMTGLKVQLFMVRGKSTNANPITIQPDTGGTDDYELMGASFLAIVNAEQQLMFFGNDSTPDVGATDKIFSLAGTASQILEVIIVAG